MSVTIRNAQQGDALRIAQIHVAAWQKGYSNLMNADFLKSLSIEDMLVSWTKALEERGKGRYLVIELNSNIMGFAVYGPSRDDDLSEKSDGELVALNIHPTEWRNGLGKKLLTSVCEDLASECYKSVNLWVISGNYPAIDLYKTAGFTYSGISKIDIKHTGYPIEEHRYELCINE